MTENTQLIDSSKLLLPPEIMPYLLIQRDEFTRFRDWVEFVRRLKYDPDKAFADYSKHAKAAIIHISRQLTLNGTMSQPMYVPYESKDFPNHEEVKSWTETATWEIIAALMSLHFSEDAVPIGE